MCFHIRPQHGVHAGLVTFSLRFESLEHIAVRDYYRAENPIAFAIRSVDPHLSAERRGPIPLPR